MITSLIWYYFELSWHFFIVFFSRLFSVRCKTRYISLCLVFLLCVCVCAPARFVESNKSQAIMQLHLIQWRKIHGKPITLKSQRKVIIKTINRAFVRRV